MLVNLKETSTFLRRDLSIVTDLILSLARIITVSKCKSEAW